MSIARTQLNAIMRGIPRYVTPSFSAATYLCPEIIAGDVVDFSAGTQTPGAYPTATVVSSVALAGAAQGASYTTQAGDVGKAVQVTTTASNAKGSASSSSASVVVAPVITPWGSDLVGGNVAPGIEFRTNRLFSNATFDSRGFGVQGTHAAGGISLDANGWPAQASELVVTTTVVSGFDGNLPQGTYHCSYKSAGQASVVTLSLTTNCSISNITQAADGVTTKFDLTIGAVSTCGLNFSGAITDLDIPRDGSTTSVGQPLFSTTAIAHYAQFSSLRLMDFCSTNVSTETTWASRAPNYACVRQPYSWETIITFINAVAAYAGSRLKKVWINVSGYVDANYATQLSALLNASLTSALTVFVEVANEPWNPAFVVYGNFRSSAMAETKVVSNYPVNSTISSVVRASNVVTVTLTGTPPAHVIVGAPFMGYDASASNSAWNVGSLAVPATVLSVGASSFTYAQTGSDATASGINIGYFFNLASTLLTDNLSFSIFDLIQKWYVRQLYTVRQAWVANRAQDRFVMNMQQYGNAAAGGCNNLPVHFDYAAYLAGGSAAWLYAAATAPYVASVGGNTTVAQILSTLTTGLTASENQMRSHVYACKLYALHPLAYEGGPDTQATPSLQVAAHTDPGMGTFVTTLLDTWFKNGGEEFHFYYVSPAPFQNGQAQGAWAAFQQFSDTTSPKIAAVTGYRNPRALSNVNGSPGDLLATKYVRRVASGQIETTNLMWYWYAQTLARSIDMLATVPRTRRYRLTLWGSDSAANTQASIYIDGVLAGTQTLPQNGQGSTPATAPGACADAFTVALTSGAHVISVRFTANVGTLPGVLKVALAAA